MDVRSLRPVRAGLVLAAAIATAGVGAWLPLTQPIPGPVTASARITPPPSSRTAGGEVPFLSRPASDPIVIRGGSSVDIANVSIRGGTVDSPLGIGITIKNVHGTITIRDVDLADLVGGIYIDNSSGVLLIENVRSRNIGDGSVGAGRSNHIQLAESSFEGRIRGNRFLGGRTEDMLSTWRSGGLGAGEELVIEDNHFQGLVADTTTARAWTSTSGTGVIISDGPGSPNNGWVIVQRNTFLNPGQVAIQHIDGEGIQTLGNVIYGERRPAANNPMTSWAGDPRGVVRDNRYCWTSADGSQPAPWFSEYGSLLVSNNVRDCAIDPDALRVDLP